MRFSLLLIGAIPFLVSGDTSLIQKVWADPPSFTTATAGHATEIAPMPRRVMRLPRHSTGVVTDVTKSSITIQGIFATVSSIQNMRRDERRVIFFEGNPLEININGHSIAAVSAISTWETLTLTDASNAITTFRRVDQPLWRLEASGGLAAREISPCIDGRMVPSSETYRLSDVRVGDIVSLTVNRENRTNICDTVCIMRRPGGRVPPAPGEPADEPRKFHEGMQALQDQEEKGTVIPRKPGEGLPEAKGATPPPPKKSNAPPMIPPARP